MSTNSFKEKTDIFSQDEVDAFLRNSGEPEVAKAEESTVKPNLTDTEAEKLKFEDFKNKVNKQLNEENPEMIKEMLVHSLYQQQQSQEQITKLTETVTNLAEQMSKVNKKMFGKEFEHPTSKTKIKFENKLFNKIKTSIIQKRKEIKEVKEFIKMKKESENVYKYQNLKAFGSTIHKYSVAPVWKLSKETVKTTRVGLTALHQKIDKEYQRQKLIEPGTDRLDYLTMFAEAATKEVATKIYEKTGIKSTFGKVKETWTKVTTSYNEFKEKSLEKANVRKQQLDQKMQDNLSNNPRLAENVAKLHKQQNLTIS